MSRSQRLIRQRRTIRYLRMHPQRRRIHDQRKCHQAAGHPPPHIPYHPYQALASASPAGNQYPASSGHIPRPLQPRPYPIPGHAGDDPSQLPDQRLLKTDDIGIISRQPAALDLNTITSPDLRDNSAAIM